MANGMSPEEAVVADEQRFRLFVVMKLQAIENNCTQEKKHSRWMDSLGKMILQSVITGAFAVGLALLTLHLKG